MVYRISVYLYIFITFKYQHGLYLEKASTATHIFYNYVLSRSNQVKSNQNRDLLSTVLRTQVSGCSRILSCSETTSCEDEECLHASLVCRWIYTDTSTTACVHVCVCVCAMHSHLHQTFHFESVICRLVGVPTISHAKQCPLQRPTAVMRLDNQLVMAISLQGKHTGYIVGCLRKV